MILRYGDKDNSPRMCEHKSRLSASALGQEFPFSWTSHNKQGILNAMYEEEEKETKKERKIGIIQQQIFLK